MYQPGLDLSVVEIEEGDSILEHLGDVTVGPLCSTPMKVSQVTSTASEDNSHGTLLTTTGSEDDSHGTLPSTAPKRQYVCDESGCTYQTPHANTRADSVARCTVDPKMPRCTLVPYMKVAVTCAKMRQQVQQQVGHRTSHKGEA